MSSDSTARGHVRLVGSIAGVGSGLTKVAVGHGYVDMMSDGPVCNVHLLALTAALSTVYSKPSGMSPFLLCTKEPLRPRRNGLTEHVPGSQEQRLTLFGHGVAGLFAGLTSAFLATPMELLKVKLQMQLQRSVADRQFRGPIDCARKVVRSQGVLGLWTGLTGSLAFRSNFFWMFMSFEGLMRGFSHLKGTSFEISTPLANFLSGGIASFAFWLMGIPADNIKNRMMTTPHTLPRPSFTATVRDIYRVGGMRGYYRGLGPCLARAFPTNACALWVYEGLMRLLDAEKVTTS